MRNLLNKVTLDGIYVLMYNNSSRVQVYLNEVSCLHSLAVVLVVRCEDKSISRVSETLVKIRR